LLVARKLLLDAYKQKEAARCYAMCNSAIIFATAVLAAVILIVTTLQRYTPTDGGEGGETPNGMRSSTSMVAIVCAGVQVMLMGIMFYGKAEIRACEHTVAYVALGELIERTGQKLADIRSQRGVEGEEGIIGLFEGLEKAIELKTKRSKARSIPGEYAPSETIDPDRYKY
jgi:hypothetical protein